MIWLHTMIRPGASITLLSGNIVGYKQMQLSTCIGA